jgi:hypothetical protein
MFFQSFTELADQKKKNDVKVFSTRNQAKCTSNLVLLLLPFGGLACFVAFKRVSRL